MIDQRTNGHLELRSVPSASTDLLTPTDLHLFNEGNHLRLYDKLGAHPLQVDGVSGTHFAVWAPNAEQVSVETFGHPPTSNALRPRGTSGIWEGFVAGIARGTIYKYRIISPGNMRWDKADPFAFHAETPPQTASVVWNLDYEWSDRTWMADRHRHNNPSGPITVYEMHL